MTTLVETIAGVRQAVARARQRGLTIGLVPTMGALHEGHGALLRQARDENGLVVASLFVNPIQFNRSDDFEKYPRTLQTDLEYCQRLHADVLFAPSAGEMYPAQQLSFVEVAELGEGLCGASRPGHFRGVATVVAKLLNIVQPDRAYFGEKDAQQLAVLTRMVADLNFACTVVRVATVREADGLAMSSRNVRLTAKERQMAPAVYEALLATAAELRAGRDVESAKRAAGLVLEKFPEFRVEYLEVVDAETLRPVERMDRPVLVITAVWLESVRLIDNLRCDPR